MSGEKFRIVSIRLQPEANSIDSYRWASDFQSNAGIRRGDVGLVKIPLRYVIVSMIRNRLKRFSKLLKS